MPNSVCHNYYTESQIWKLLNNEQTYTSLELLEEFSIKMSEKTKNPADGLQFGVDLRDTKKKTLKNINSLTKQSLTKTKKISKEKSYI